MGANLKITPEKPIKNLRLKNKLNTSKVGAEILRIHTASSIDSAGVCFFVTSKYDCINNSRVARRVLIQTAKKGAPVAGSAISTKRPDFRKFLRGTLKWLQ